MPSTETRTARTELAQIATDSGWQVWQGRDDAAYKRPGLVVTATFAKDGSVIDYCTGVTGYVARRVGGKAEALAGILAAGQ